MRRFTASMLSLLGFLIISAGSANAQIPSGTFTVTNQPIANFATWAQSAATTVTGDFNGDGKTDIALVGGQGWDTQPVAFSNGDGTFNVTNRSIADFATLAQSAGVHVITGDFNADGKTDLALVGGPEWTTQPVAFSNGDGTFNVTNRPIVHFASWARWVGSTVVTVVTGDFNGDGKTDIALAGGQWWTTQPVAFSNGDGTFIVTNHPIADFADWAQSTGVKTITGDFNGDGKTDMVLVGGPASTTQPVAFSNGDGTFNVTNQPIANFAGWAQLAGITVVTGDFNGDGKTDIALAGGQGWNTQPVAFSNGDGTFNVTNQPVAGFGAWAQFAGVKVIKGDFNGDGKADIALVGGSGWNTQPIAYSNGDGNFTVTNKAIVGIGSWATYAGAQPYVGKFAGKARDDLALVGGQGWQTQPVAFSDAY